MPSLPGASVPVNHCGSTQSSKGRQPFGPSMPWTRKLWSDPAGRFLASRSGRWMPFIWQQRWSFGVCRRRCGSCHSMIGFATMRPPSGSTWYRRLLGSRPLLADDRPLRPPYSLQRVELAAELVLHQREGPHSSPAGMSASLLRSCPDDSKEMASGRGSCPPHRSSAGFTSRALI